MKALLLLRHLKDDERKVTLDVGCDLPLNFFLFIPINQMPLSFPLLAGLRVPVPLLKKWITGLVQESPTYVLAKDAAILSLFDEVLLQSWPQLVIPRMRAHTNYPDRVMPSFACFKQDVDTVLGNPAGLERKREAFLLIKQMV